MSARGLRDARVAPLNRTRGRSPSVEPRVRHVNHKHYDIVQMACMMLPYMGISPALRAPKRESAQERPYVDRYENESRRVGGTSRMHDARCTHVLYITYTRTLPCCASFRDEACEVVRPGFREAGSSPSE